MDASLPALAGASQPPRTALVGFDGYVDSLYRVVRDHAGGKKNPYADIPEFAQELFRRAGKSGGFELARLSVRAGGNAPLMASGLASLGVAASCVGALGLPGLDPVFQPLLERGCGLLSVAEAATTSALEFGDGKIMLNDSRPFEDLDWKALRRAAGTEHLRSLAGPADLIALVDWANMPHATDLWRGLLEEILEPLGAGARGKKIFFDLADISRAESGEIRALLGLLRRFKAFGETALGLNENEAQKLAERLDLKAAPDRLEDLGRALYAALGLDLLVIHPRHQACVFSAAEAWTVPGVVVEKPLLSTGGGDHFNAGFCLGWLRGLEPAEAAALACRVSGFYVAQGRSPGLEDLKMGSAAP